MWTQRQNTPGEDAGKGRGDASTSQGAAEAASAPSELRERQGSGCPSGPPAGTSQHLISNFLPPELGDKTFLLFQWPSPSKQIHSHCTHFNLFVLITYVPAAGLTLSLQATAEPEESDSAEVFSLSNFPSRTENG